MLCNVIHLQTHDHCKKSIAVAQCPSCAILNFNEIQIQFIIFILNLYIEYMQICTRLLFKYTQCVCMCACPYAFPRQQPVNQPRFEPSKRAEQRLPSTKVPLHPAAESSFTAKLRSCYKPRRLHCAAPHRRVANAARGGARGCRTPRPSARGPWA